MFLDFPGLVGPIKKKEMAIDFIKHAKKASMGGKQTHRVYSLSARTDRIRRDICFCEMNRISRGLPSGRKSATDRAPDLEELQKLIEYPDQSIKAIVCMMISSGICKGAWTS